MNLKMKLTHKVTSTVQIITPTQCIYSDDVSPTHINALQVLEAPTKEQLWDNIKALAISHAKPTRFKPVIALINKDSIQYISL